MKKVLLLAISGSLLGLSACAPVYKCGEEKPAGNISGSNRLIAVVEERDELCETVKVKEEENEFLLGKNQELSMEKDSLMSENRSLVKSYNELEEEHLALEEKHQKLQDDHVDLGERFSKMMTDKLNQGYLYDERIKEKERRLALKEEELERRERRIEELEATIARQDSIAKRLNRITRENDYVARLGSDEFAIFLQNIGTPSDLNILINRFHQQLTAPFIIEGDELYVSYSFGIATYPDDSKDSEELVNLANIARTKAKKSGGNQFVFFRPKMNENAQETLSLENDLRKALKNNEIEVYYQPQVSAKTLEPTGAEALVRWNHPTRGLISPAIFIPLAESTGLIIEIGEYVLQKAIKTAQKWHQAGYPLHFWINLSGRQFSQSNLMADIQQLVSRSSLDPHFIDLEITESLAMSNAKSNIQRLNGLKAMGLMISIDDFGTGYSSLAYLQSFPIDTIKVDRSFILNLGTKEGDAITRTILAMAESLNLNVVAEGIEDPEHIEFFKNKHCHIFQGFKFGKPMPENNFFKWLKNYNSQHL